MQDHIISVFKVAFAGTSYTDFYGLPYDAKKKMDWTSEIKNTNSFMPWRQPIYICQSSRSEFVQFTAT